MVQKHVLIFYAFFDDDDDDDDALDTKCYFGHVSDSKVEGFLPASL